ncbi:hypothetical protein CO051_03665 [Candidatus Roizmanbacteria bacterium CG_4_9_14_0_2_um_filter_39_13]|uniref:Membrane insertase YidC/Oxa/ALB C-terminal domain-containing protein n=2 Tax=Candidatus Roizmaniibacteriota TaxID=1752723 RepID=A0A2M8EYV4_9BACT|nr:MAG: hypothetical protein CO051_03665 [Candidatus Roizmanbacteria bacterium CG_4_9_14_0_2_um_filter_39_13]PJE61747.1 MAG: hypothetical protein COU87_02930 [Candidatus Roizmanbacteria bacterium CG10_big_fil_rev_8_21_14_0_10_39_12]
MLQTIGTTFHTIFVIPIINVLVMLYDVLTSVGIPGALGFAIITITVAIRFLMHPLFQKQMKTAQVMKDLKPQLDALQKKYKKDPKKLQAEQLKLYQEAGINPASGCLFAIIQMPIIFGLYQALNQFFNTNGYSAKIQEINKQLYFPNFQIENLNTLFIGFDLAKSPAQAGLWFYYLIPVLTAGLQFWQSKVTMTANPMTDLSAIKDDKENKEKDKDGKKEGSTSEEFQKAMNTQMKYFFPIMIGYFSYTLPIGLSIYWNAFSLFSIIQHYITQKNKK